MAGPDQLERHAADSTEPYEPPSIRSLGNIRISTRGKPFGVDEDLQKSFADS